MLFFRVQNLVAEDNYQNIIDPTPDQTYKKRKLCGQVQGRDANLVLSDNIEEPTSGWGKSIPVTIIENFSDVNIHEYALNSGKKALKIQKSQAGKKTCIRPETRGYQFFIENYIHCIWALHEANHIFFKARCFPSQRKNDEPHKIWCAIKVDSLDVVKASCSCTAGLSGYCNHTVALLYQISHYAKAATAIIPDDLSRTSLPQCWHKPRIEGVSAEPIMQVTPRIPHTDTKPCSSRTCTLYEARRSTAIANNSELLREVQANMAAENPLYGITYMASGETDQTEYCRTQLDTYVPRGSVLSYQLALTEGDFHVECNFESLQKFACVESCVLRKVPFPTFPLDALTPYTVSDNLSQDMKDKLNSLTVNQEQASDIELMTRDQASNDTWWQERKYRLTASTFSEICRRKKKNCDNLVKRLMGNETQSVKVPLPIKHGKSFENAAARKYFKYMSHIGHKVEISASGLVIRPDLPFLGCSPDRKVMDPISHPHYGIVEIKCPYKYRSVTPKEAIDMGSDFCLEKTAAGLCLKRSHPYFQQIQGQMGLTGTKWCDFVVYTFKGLSIERVPFYPTVWDEMKDNLEKFYFTSFLPIALK